MQRRNFVKTAGLAAAAAPQLLRAQQPKLRVGFIGLGRRGLGNLKTVLNREDCVVTALSDVYKPNLDLAVEMSPAGAKVYPDFRDLIAANDVDVVFIGTPDHWHAYMTVEACKAGKDVYVEKPSSVTVYEGQMMVKAAQKYERIVQVGTQQRSGDHFQQAVKMIQNDEIGDIAFVRTWNYSNQVPGIGNPPDSDAPANLDWDMWLGPAPERRFNANRFGVHPNRFSDFRWFWDYAGGMMTDWGVHLLDIVLWAMDEPGPRAVSAVGSKYVIQDNRETPDTILANYEFPSFACVYENRITNAQSMFGQGYGILFHGTKGTMFVDRSRWEILPEKERVATGTRNRIPAAQGESGNNSTAGHWEDFISSVRDRSKPICDMLTGHRSTTIALLGNVALRSKERFEWDPLAETTDNQEAAGFLKREAREPWKLEL